MRERERIPELLTIVSVSTPVGDTVPGALLQTIEELQSISGHVIVLARGENIALHMPLVDVIHFEERFGPWGAVYAADPRIRAILEEKKIQMVALNLAPRYFSSENTHMLAQLMQDCGAYHIIGRRGNIAAQAGSHALALTECFLTLLAESICGIRGVFRDGFSGLQVFSCARWLGWNWWWIEHTTLGGVLEAQRQTAMGYDIDYCPIFHSGIGDWIPAVIGTDEKMAMASVLGRVLALPMFSSIRRHDVLSALHMVADRFATQPWMNARTAEQDVRGLIEYYNGQVTTARRLPL